MKRNDLLWKAALEDFFNDFLQFFYPMANTIFDLDRGFEYLDKELEQLFPASDDGPVRYVDKLVKVFTRDGSEGWVLVHIEVQGYKDNNFAKRMYQYNYRLFDKYDKPITAFAILTDGNEGFHPTYYEIEFLGTRTYYGFNTWKISDQNDKDLEVSDNPFAMVLLTAKLALDGRRLPEDQLFDRAIGLARRLLNKKMPKNKIRALMNFLRYYVRFENQQLITKFDNEITTLTQGGKPMGIEEFLLDSAKKEGRVEGRVEGREEGRVEGRVEGREEGRVEGREEGRGEGIRETASKMKHSGLDISLIAQVTGLSIAEIEAL